MVTNNVVEPQPEIIEVITTILIGGFKSRYRRLILAIEFLAKKYGVVFTIKNEALGFLHHTALISLEGERIAVYQMIKEMKEWEKASQ